MKCENPQTILRNLRHSMWTSGALLFVALVIAGCGGGGGGGGGGGNPPPPPPPVSVTLSACSAAPAVQCAPFTLTGTGFAGLRATDELHIGDGPPIVTAVVDDTTMTGHLPAAAGTHRVRVMRDGVQIGNALDMVVLPAELPAGRTADETLADISAGLTELAAQLTLPSDLPDGTVMADPAIDNIWRTAMQAIPVLCADLDASVANLTEEERDSLARLIAGSGLYDFLAVPSAAPASGNAVGFHRCMPVINVHLLLAQLRSEPRYRGNIYMTLDVMSAALSAAQVINSAAMVGSAATGYGVGIAAVLANVNECLGIIDTIIDGVVPTQLEAIQRIELVGERDWLNPGERAPLVVYGRFGAQMTYSDFVIAAGTMGFSAWKTRGTKYKSVPGKGLSAAQTQVNVYIDAAGDLAQSFGSTAAGAAISGLAGMISNLSTAVNARVTDADVPVELSTLQAAQRRFGLVFNNPYLTGEQIDALSSKCGADNDPSYPSFPWENPAVCRTVGGGSNEVLAVGGGTVEFSNITTYSWQQPTSVWLSLISFGLEFPYAVTHTGVAGTIRVNAPPIVGPTTAVEIAGPVSLPLQLADDLTPTDDLVLTASCDDALMFPGGSLVFSGVGASRILTATPAVGHTGPARLTVTATDAGGLAGQCHIDLVVGVSAAPVLALAFATSEVAPGGSTRIDFTFSEGVVGFTASAITVLGGVPGTLTQDDGGGSRYHMLITAGASGTVAVSVPAGAVTDVDGNALLQGASATQPIRIPTTGWDTSGSLTTGGRYNHRVALLADGRVLLAGGAASGAPGMRTCELYDPSSRAWTATGQMISGRYVHALSRLRNGEVLVSGGAYGANVPMASCEIYNPLKGIWAATGSLATARYNHAQVSLADGRQLVAGGGPATCEIYNPSSRTWSATGSLSLARGHVTLTTLADGRLLATGGGPMASAVCEIYDAATGTWSLTGNLQQGRFGHAAVLLPSGKVLVMGGVRGTGASNYLASCELYDPSTGTWSLAGAMAYSRQGFSAILLGDGSVAAIGGESGTGGINYPLECEIYTPALDRWRIGGRLISGRYGVATTSLANGDLLVTAGVSSVGGFLASCDLFAPPR